MCTYTHTEIYLKIKNKTQNNFKTQNSSHSLPLEIDNHDSFLYACMSNTKCFILFSSIIWKPICLLETDRKKFKDSRRYMACLPPSLLLWGTSKFWCQHHHHDRHTQTGRQADRHTQPPWTHSPEQITPTLGFLDQRRTR